MPRLLEIESDAKPDFLDLRELARGRLAARTLSEATGGDLTASARFRDVLAPSGIRHEVRVIFRDAVGTWGALILMRGGDVHDFSNAELNLLASLSSRVAEGLRRSALIMQAAAPSPGPGLLLLSISDRLVIDHATEAARRWLADIDDGSADGIPHAIAACARQAFRRADAAGKFRSRIRTRAGHWMTLHAERLGPSSVSVILTPSHPYEVAALLADVYRLTTREREVVALAVRGHANTEIAKALWLSPYTVQDHLKSAFDKVGVSNRSELTAKLYFDHSVSEGLSRAPR
jgi:DNA-binding CsgD family transcriptional regulator